MIKLPPILFAIAILFFIFSLFSCKNHSQGSTTIAYAGRIIFKPTGKELNGISRNGFFSFNKNGKQLDVKCDNQMVTTYQINNGDKTTTPNNEEKEMIIEALNYCKTSGLINKTPPYLLEEKSIKTAPAKIE